MKITNRKTVRKLSTIIIRLSLLGLFFTSSFGLEEPALEERVAQIKEALNTEIELPELDSKTAEELAFSPFDLSLEEAIEYAMTNNLSFKNSLALLEVASRGVNSIKAGLYEPSLQFGYSKRANNNPAQGFIPQFTSQNEGGSVNYKQQFSDGTNLSLTYNSSNSSVVFGINLTIVDYNCRLGELYLEKIIHSMNETRLRNSRLDKKIAYFEYLDAYQALVLKVTEAYLNAVKAQRQIGVSESVLSSRQELLDLTKLNLASVFLLNLMY